MHSGINNVGNVHISSVRHDRLVNGVAHNPRVYPYCLAPFLSSEHLRIMPTVIFLTVMVLTLGLYPGIFTFLSFLVILINPRVSRLSDSSGHYCPTLGLSPRESPLFTVISPLFTVISLLS